MLRFKYKYPFLYLNMNRKMYHISYGRIFPGSHILFNHVRTEYFVEGLEVYKNRDIVERISP